MVDFEGGINKAADLCFRQYDDFFLHQFWWACPLDWIAVQLVSPHSFVEAPLSRRVREAC